MTLYKKIKQFCIYYFGNMPRDKYNFKFRWQQALCYLDWHIEDVKARETTGGINDRHC